MSKKINVGILLGGPSVEHEISIVSALNIADALVSPDTKKKYDVKVFLIGITRSGEWLLIKDSLKIKESKNSNNLPLEIIGGNGSVVGGGNHDSDSVGSGNGSVVGGGSHDSDGGVGGGNHDNDSVDGEQYNDISGGGGSHDSDGGVGGGNHDSDSVGGEQHNDISGSVGSEHHNDISGGVVGGNHDSDGGGKDSEIKFSNFENLVLFMGKKNPIRIAKNFSDENGGALEIDLIIPAIHGTNGEDGSIQGLLKHLKIPFVGCNILGSVLGMDKEMTKIILKDHVNVAKYKVVHKSELSELKYADICVEFGLPFFIKATSQGSSLGVYKIKNEADFNKYIIEVFKFDVKILIEECLVGREVECAVLGNENPKASLPGEIEVDSDFYTYEIKYVNINKAKLHAPAILEKNIIKEIQDTSLKVFKLLKLEGLSRIDFFLTKNNKLYVNEVNTFPGFTKVSMFPKLWEISGITQGNLMIELIDLAFERDNLIKNLKITP